MRSTLSKEEKEEYEKFKNDPSKLNEDDKDIVEVVPMETETKG